MFSIVREWLLAVCICRKGTHDEKLAWTFRLYDTDGSGSIDFEEVKMDPFYSDQDLPGVRGPIYGSGCLSVTH